MRLIKELSKDITLTPVCNIGYTERDMTSYYSGTFLMYETPEGHTVVYCQGARSEASMECSVLGEDGLEDKNIPIRMLFRFTPLQGFYDLPRNSLVEYSLPTTRSYKKGINRELVRLHTKRSGNNNSISSVRSQMLSLGCICSKPEGTFLNGSRVLSRRLAIHEGKLYTTFKNRTVGTYTDGVIHTPFVSIIDRIHQLGGNIKCQLQRL